MITHVPFAYQLGPLQITGFGVGVLLAFVIAQMVAQEVLAARGEDPEIMGDVTVAAVIGGLLGAKIYYTILTGDITTLWSRGGFVFWGGLIGGTIAVAATVKYKKAQFTHVSDAIAPGLAAAYAVGRTGCFAVGDDYGRPWDGPLAVAFPEGAPPSTVENLVQQFGLTEYANQNPTDVLGVHPTQLYEVALALAMFAILWCFRDHTRQRGWLFGLYFVLAGLERFAIEFFRAKDDRFVMGMTVAQTIAIIAVGAGATWMAMRRQPRSA